MAKRTSRLIGAIVSSALGLSGGVAACGGGTSGSGSGPGTNGDAAGGGADGGSDAVAPFHDGFTVLPCQPQGLAAVTPGTPTDYMAIRLEKDFASNPDAGPPPETVEETGTKCKTATDQAKCTSALDAIRYPITGGCGVPYPCASRYLVFTRADEVGSIPPSAPASVLAQFLAPIDSPEEAAFLLGERGQMVVCGVSSYKASGDGWDFDYVQDLGCTGGGGTPDAPTHVLVHVARDGTVTELESVELPKPTGVGCAAARRATDGVYALPASVDAAGAWLAAAAHLEASSVHSFARLARELAAHGAPLRLVARAARAARDERRHAQLLRALARRSGHSVPRTSRLPSRIRALPEIALENATEGALRETWGAVVAAFQAETAADPSIRAAMQTIARDEATHASLAGAVAVWIESRIAKSDRARVTAARRATLVAIANEAARPLAPHVRAPLGLPDAAQARSLFDGARATLFDLG